MIGCLVTLTLVVVCASNNATWDKVREKKARIVKKLKKDSRKLKKQEGAMKLVGGENGHEGRKRLRLSIFVRLPQLNLKIHILEMRDIF